MRAYLALGGVYGSKEDFRSAANLYDKAVEQLKTPTAANWNIFYQRGIAAAKPQNAKAARAALPLFQRALSYLQGSGVESYASETRGVNLSQTVSAVRQYIDIQNQIIKRGQ